MKFYFLLNLISFYDENLKIIIDDSIYKYNYDFFYQNLYLFMENINYDIDKYKLIYILFFFNFMKIYYNHLYIIKNSNLNFNLLKDCIKLFIEINLNIELKKQQQQNPTITYSIEQKNSIIENLYKNLNEKLDDLFYSFFNITINYSTKELYFNQYPLHIFLEQKNTIEKEQFKNIFYNSTDKIKNSVKQDEIIKQKYMIIYMQIISIYFEKVISGGRKNKKLKIKKVIRKY